MPNNPPTPIQDAPTPPIVAERIQAFRGLADSARARFESRREMEWRVAIGIWSAFGGGAAVVLSARSWCPSWWDTGFGVLFVGTVWFLYGYYWLPYLIETGHRELRQQYFWETHIEKETGVCLPEYLTPPKRAGEMPWASAFTLAASSPEPVAAIQTGESNSPKKSERAWHVAVRLQFVAAILFGFLFVGSLASRAATRVDSSAPKQGISIEGKSVTIESMNGIRLDDKRNDK